MPSHKFKTTQRKKTNKVFSNQQQWRSWRCTTKGVHSIGKWTQTNILVNKGTILYAHKSSRWLKSILCICWISYFNCINSSINSLASVEWNMIAIEMNVPRLGSSCKCIKSLPLSHHHHHHQRKLLHDHDRCCRCYSHSHHLSHRKCSTIVFTLFIDF